MNIMRNAKIIDYKIIIYYYFTQVYPMSDGVRGRALIINIYNFYSENVRIDTRVGSDVDHKNLQYLLCGLGFLVADEPIATSSLTAQVRLININFNCDDY